MPIEKMEENMFCFVRGVRTEMHFDSAKLAVDHIQGWLNQRHVSEPPSAPFASVLGSQISEGARGFDRFNEQLEIYRATARLALGHAIDEMVEPYSRQFKCIDWTDDELKALRAKQDEFAKAVVESTQQADVIITEIEQILVKKARKFF